MKEALSTQGLKWDNYNPEGLISKVKSYVYGINAFQLKSLD